VPKVVLSEEAASTTDYEASEVVKEPETGLLASYLKELPVATVYEKLNFPLKFDKDQFVLDFSSGQTSSDPETFKKPFLRSSTYHQYRLDFYPQEKCKNT
jgi:hypothetical protein